MHIISPVTDRVQPIKSLRNDPIPTMMSDSATITVYPLCKEVGCTVLVYNGPSTRFKVISSWVSLLIHIVPEQASYAVYQYLVHILSPLTDNCPSRISGKEKMISYQDEVYV